MVAGVARVQGWGNLDGQLRSGHDEVDETELTGGTDETGSGKDSGESGGETHLVQISPVRRNEAVRKGGEEKGNEEHQRIYCSIYTVRDKSRCFMVLSQLAAAVRELRSCLPSRTSSLGGSTSCAVYITQTSPHEAKMQPRCDQIDGNIGHMASGWRLGKSLFQCSLCQR